MKKLMITLVAVFGLAIVATGFAATQSAASESNHVASSTPPTALFGPNSSTPPTALF